MTSKTLGAKITIAGRMVEHLIGGKVEITSIDGGYNVYYTTRFSNVTDGFKFMSFKRVNAFKPYTLAIQIASSFVRQIKKIELQYEMSIL